MERSRLPWLEFTRQEYTWTTPLRGGEKSAQLAWVTEKTWLAGRPKFALVDRGTGECLAEFASHGRRYMGGVLTIHETGGQRFDQFGLKVLMSFLAIYETARRKSHCTVYGSTSWKSAALP
jgi:hypothetical protein